MEPAVLVKVTDLYRYYGGIPVVFGISFEVRRGEVLGFLGPNGAGKTSTLQMVCGALAPHAGIIRVAGEDLLEAPRLAKQQIGYLPEIPPIYPELTVDEYLLYCARLRRVARDACSGAIDNAKTRCGLEAVGRRLAGHLSKGYQQRLGIAQAIVHEPPVLVLDEPTVGLDPIQIREIRALIIELKAERAVLLSTHILSEAQAVCDRVQIMHRGELVLSERVEGITDLEEVFVRLTAEGDDARSRAQER